MNLKYDIWAREKEKEAFIQREINVKSFILVIFYFVSILLLTVTPLFLFGYGYITLREASPMGLINFLIFIIISVVALFFNRRMERKAREMFPKEKQEYLTTIRAVHKDDIRNLERSLSEVNRERSAFLLNQIGNLFKILIIATCIIFVLCSIPSVLEHYGRLNDHGTALWWIQIFTISSLSLLSLLWVTYFVMRAIALREFPEEKKIMREEIKKKLAESR